MGPTRRCLLLVWLAASTLTPSLAEAEDQAAGAPSSEWSIRPQGLGRLDLRETVRMAAARALYPEARVEVREGRYDGSLDQQLFYVFLDGEKALFASACLCELDESGVPRSRLKEIREQEQMWVHPITTDPRFRTERGIGVGSTVRELVKAYPELPRLIYQQEGATGPDLPAAEWVCLLRKGAARGREDALENVRFFVRQPGGKVAAGQPREGKLKKQRVDLGAVIVAVEPDQTCTERYP